MPLKGLLEILLRVVCYRTWLLSAVVGSCWLCVSIMEALCCLWHAYAAFLTGTPPTDVYNLCLAIALLLVIIVSSLFTYYQDVKAIRILSGFQTLVPSECIVIRDGCPVSVLSKSIVVGDLVVLQTGGKVPADIRAITSHNLRVDKSLLTGEAEPCKASNILLMGCNVVEGEGTGLVIAT
eukprot:13729-Heterococcus_DN1.PRE.1